jgi:hypothetical protein
MVPADVQAELISMGTSFPDPHAPAVNPFARKINKRRNPLDNILIRHANLYRRVQLSLFWMSVCGEAGFTFKDTCEPAEFSVSHA